METLGKKTVIKLSENDKLRRLAYLFGSFADLETFACGDHLDFDALMTLIWLQNMGGCTAGVLSQALCFSPSTTTRNLKKLESLGLVEELLDAGDLRRCYFQSSKRGENITFEVIKQWGRDSIFWQMERFIELREGACAAKPSDGGGLTSTAQRLLLVLHAAGKALTQRSLCEHTRLPQTRVSMCLKELEKRQFVKSSHCEADRRVRMVELTAEGHMLATSMRTGLSI